MNVFTRLLHISDGGASGFNCDLSFWWCQSVTLIPGLSPYTVTASTNITSNKTLAIKCWELSGLTAVDQTGTANSSSNSSASATVTAGGADAGSADFVIAAICIGFGSTALTDPPGTTNPVAFSSSYTNPTAFDIGHRLNGSSQTNNANWSWTTNDQYAAGIASFNGSGSLAQNVAGRQVTGLGISSTFGALPSAGHSIVVAVLATPWNPAYAVTSVTDNQIQGAVPLGGLTTEWHWRSS